MLHGNSVRMSRKVGYYIFAHGELAPMENWRPWRTGAHGELAMAEVETVELLKRYSEARISAVELRRALGRATFADVLIELAKRNLPLPRAPEAGASSGSPLPALCCFP